MKEIFKDVNGYKGLYRVSNTGKVIGTKELTPRKTQRGYLRVNLSQNNSVIDKYIHRLVAEHFIDNPLNKPEVNHKNGIKSDNRVDNLEWNTRRENCKHAFKKGFLPQFRPRKGSENGRAVLDNKEIRGIRKSTGKTTLELSKIYGVSTSTICRIRNRTSWKHLQ